MARTEMDYNLQLILIRSLSSAVRLPKIVKNSLWVAILSKNHFLGQGRIQDFIKTGFVSRHESLSGRGGGGVLHQHFQLHVVARGYDQTWIHTK